jgi:hypothetical protein
MNHTALDRLDNAGCVAWAVLTRAFGQIDAGLTLTLGDAA